MTEVERRAYEESQIAEERRRILVNEYCRNVAHRETNFQRIAASPEALASWLDEHAEFCAEIPCDECSVNKECWHQGCDVDFSSNVKRWISWLKQESK